MFKGYKCRNKFYSKVLHISRKNDCLGFTNILRILKSMQESKEHKRWKGVKYFPEEVNELGFIPVRDKKNRLMHYIRG